MSNDPAVELFKQNWTIYQKLISNNYMFHRQWNEATNDIIDKLKAHGPVHILDLGCGDASFIRAIENPEWITSYTGIDLSPSALEYAANYLDPLNIKFSLITGRMEEMILKTTGKYQLIYSSYAIHHLQDGLKIELLKDIYDRLDDHGIFILIDVFRKQNQTREQYLRDYKNYMDDDWNALLTEDKVLIYDHILNFDFPALIGDAKSWLSKLALHIEDRIEHKVGSKGQKLDEFHRMLVMSK